MKRIVSACVLTCVLVLPLPLRAGVVSGTAINRTTEKPAEGVEVQLFGTTSSVASGRDTTDDRGLFSFGDVTPGEYVLGATYEGVSYFERNVLIGDAASEVSRDLDLYESTNSSEAIRIRTDHVILDASDENPQVTEVIVFENTGKRSYLGEVSPASPSGHLLALPLPTGYTGLSAPDRILMRIFDRSENGFRLALSLSPGITQINFTYRVPSGFLGVRMARRFPFAVNKVNIAVPTDAGWRLRSDDLTNREQANLRGKTYLIAGGGPFEAGREVVIRLSRGLLGTGIPTGRAAWGFGGFLIAGASLTWILRQGRKYE